MKSFNAELEKDFSDVPKASIIESIDGIPIDNYVKSLMDKRFLHYHFNRKKLTINGGLIPVEASKEYSVKFITTDKKSIVKNVKSKKILSSYLLLI